MVRVVAALVGSLALAATLALTVPRFLDPTNYALVALAAATPLGLFTGAIATAALLGIARMRHDRPRRAAVAATAGTTALLLTGAHAAWLAPLVIGSSPSGRSNRPGVSVLSQNLEYGGVDALDMQVRRAGADIVVLVDLTPRTARTLLGSSLMQTYPYRGGLSTRTPSGTVVLSKYPLVAEHLLDPSGSSRSYQVTTSPIGPFVIAALHPTPPYEEGTRPWRSELDSIRRSLTREGQSSGPLIAVGDLNATSDHRPYRRLLATTGLRDAAELTHSGWAPTFPIGGRFTTMGIVLPPVVRIDHALVSPTLTAQSLTRVTITGADHAGLLLRVQR